MRELPGDATQGVTRVLLAADTEEEVTEDNSDEDSEAGLEVRSETGLCGAGDLVLGFLLTGWREGSGEYGPRRRYRGLRWGLAGY